MDLGITIHNENTKLIIGDNVNIGKGLILGENCKKINIGYGSMIGNDVYIDVPELTIGEYTSIHKNTTIHGYTPCSIGHNCWIGQNTIIDSIGGTTIGNNVGIGGYSQLWSHIKFGDTLEGCRWNSKSSLIIEDDVWFVGHCIVSPIHAKCKSMLFVGGVVTKDMEANHIYAGAPAKDITDKVGTQFAEKSLDDKKEELIKLYSCFLRENNISKDKFIIDVLNSIDEYDSNGKENITTFFIEERQYTPTRSEMEFMFMKYLLYDKAKFTPIKKEEYLAI